MTTIQPPHEQLTSKDDLQYEFTAEQNMAFKRFAVLTSSVGILCIIVGIIIILQGISLILNQVSTVEAVFRLLIGLMVIALGILFVRPTDNFRRIVRTRGRDISEFLIGISEISRTLALARGLIVVVIILRVIQFFASGNPS